MRRALDSVTFSRTTRTATSTAAEVQALSTAMEGTG